MRKFYIKKGDTSPAIEYALSPFEISLVGASVVFNMKDGEGAVKVSRQAATITDDGGASDTPTVQYDWASADTDTAGLFYAEFEVTYADDTVETFPNQGFIPVLVSGDIA